MGREVKERGARPLAKRPNPKYQRPDKALLRRYPVGPQAEPGWGPSGRGQAPKAKPLRPLHPARKPPKLYLPGVRTARFAPVRILPGFGPVSIGHDIGTLITGAIVRDLARGFPQPPNETQVGYVQEFGAWDLGYYKGTSTPGGAYPWLSNPNFEYIRVGDSIPTAGSRSTPGVGASGAQREFWKFGDLRGRWYFLSDRIRLDNGERLSDRQYWEMSWLKVSASPSWTSTPGTPARVGRPYIPFPNPYADPNRVRTLPGVAPVPGLQPAPWEAPGIAPRQSPLPRTKTSPRLRGGIRLEHQAFPDPAYAPVAAPSVETAVKALTAQSNHKRTKSRYKERKMLSRAARIGIAAWDILDQYSELSEIGGAFWDALPKDIQKAARCPKNFTFGQYGNDLNRCQLDTLVANWDKIDPVEAFKNLAKNAVEDMTIGQFHKFLAKFYPPGISFQRTAITHAASKAKPEAYISGRLKELWEFLGI